MMNIRYNGPLLYHIRLVGLISMKQTERHYDDNGIFLSIKMGKVLSDLATKMTTCLHYS